MSYKVTKKQIIAETPKSKLFAVDYCAMTNLLINHRPIAHTRGRYGWNFDVYNFYGITICMGYRGMPGITPQNLEKYEAKAKQIFMTHIALGFSYEEACKRVEELLKEFCAQA